MKKETRSKIIKKPQLNDICPARFFQRINPSLILNHPKRQYYDLSQHHTQNFKQINNLKKMQAATCSDWLAASDNIKKFRNYSRKERIQRNGSKKQQKEQENQRKTQSFYKRRRGSHQTGQKKRLIYQVSPYVKNMQEYQRIINNLKPVKGPTQSVMRQLKKYNQQHKKNTQNVLLASKQSFKQKIMKYSSRIGLAKDQKIFVMNSKDFHIRQSLLRHGWVQNSDLSSTFFHLKWVYNDSPADYTRLQQGQLFNHFKNNQQLTNKNLFRKNIYKNPIQEQPNYPISFDLEASEDQIRFQIEYIKYQYYNVLDKLQRFIMSHTQYKFKEYFQKFMKNDYLGFSCGPAFNFSIPKIKQRDFVKYMQPKIFEGKQFQQSRQFRQILYALCFILSEFIQQSKQEDITKRHSRRLSYINYCNQIRGIIKLVINCIKGIKIQEKLVLLQHDQMQQPQQWITKKQVNKISQNLAKAFNYDRFLLVFLLLLHKKIRRKYQNNFGIDNWWIIKPAGVSRGTGIKIERDLNKILASKYGKIVQKYIQKPLLLSCGRKFDIRQWVMVTSFAPLQAYLFQKCYCRFSALKYTQQNFQTLSVHLTNYSKQKQNFQKKGLNLQNSIMSEQELCQLIDNRTWKGKWSNIRNYIKNQIAKSLKCCQYEIQDKEQCFQVFGFDIILDQLYNPWVLEVNLSPACERRAEFLNGYLNNMAEGIIDLIQMRQIRHWERIQYQQPNVEKKSLLNQLNLDQMEAANRIQRYFKKIIRQPKKIKQIQRQEESQPIIKEQISKFLLNQNFQ